MPIFFALAHKIMTRTNISLQLTQVIVSVAKEATRGYDNGTFIPVFQDALGAIARDTKLTGMTLRVLCFLLSRVQPNNRIYINRTEIAEILCCDISSVSRAINTLIKMNIICSDGSDTTQHHYTMSPNIINPRLAYHGNTRKLKKNTLPVLLSSDGNHPLIQGAREIPEFLDMDSKIQLSGELILSEPIKDDKSSA